MKYHSEGISKNKKIKKERKKPIPFGLMAMGYTYDKYKKCWFKRVLANDNPFLSENV